LESEYEYLSYVESIRSQQVVSLHFVVPIEVLFEKFVVTTYSELAVASLEPTVEPSPSLGTALDASLIELVAC